jgi:hypothetical protein
VKPHIAARAGTLAVLAVLVTACGSRMDVTVYEPGVYKGSTDPLLDAHGTDEHKELLRQRLAKVEAER